MLRTATSSASDSAKGLLAVLLFSLWPCLNFANRNRERLDGSGVEFLIAFFCAVLLLGWAGFLGACLVTGWRRIPSLCLATVAVITFFFNHSSIVRALDDLGLGAVSVPLSFALLVAICAASLRFGNRGVVFQVLLLFGSVVTLIPGYALAVYALRPEPDLRAGIEAPAYQLKSTPSIFHIVVDSYPRADAASRFLSFDNRGFVAALAERDFYVAEESYSNYPATFLSISSTLTMNYLVTEETPRFKAVGSQFYPITQGDNAAAAFLRAQGYAHVQQGASVTDVANCGDSVDLCLNSGLSALKQAVLDLTPLALVTRLERPTTPKDFGVHLDEVFAQGSPVYTFIHTNPPHPPRSFRKGCTPETDEVPLSDFWRDRSGFTLDMQCVNEQLLGLVDDILARDPTAVIAIHGDHGSAFGVDWRLPIDGWSEAQIEERFSILMAVRLPERCRGHLYPRLSPINLYRIVFSCLADVETTRLPDEMYISPKPSHEDWGTAHRVPSRPPGGSRGLSEIRSSGKSNAPTYEGEVTHSGE